PDCEDRGQAGGGLSTGRNPQRYYAEDAGVLRADDRLRGREDSEMGVREIPRRGHHFGYADEVGGRGDGDRADVQGGAVEGDSRLAKTWGANEIDVRSRRKELGVKAVFSRVDTCAAEFESFTPYLYSNYESACEADPSDRKKVMILGSGPNRIGQGIEFDYCCCHASFALQEMGVESIMVNCNPETVSTDYDTSDRLYFEPLTLENVLNVYDTEKPDGVIV